MANPDWITRSVAIWGGITGTFKDHTLLIGFEWNDEVKKIQKWQFAHFADEADLSKDVLFERAHIEIRAQELFGMKRVYAVTIVLDRYSWRARRRQLKGVINIDFRKEGIVLRAMRRMKDVFYHK